MTLGFLIDDIYWLHDTGSRHPESPRRLTAIREALDSYDGLPAWEQIKPRAALEDELAWVHRPSQIDRVAKAVQSAPALLDPDTPVSSESFRSGIFAAGGVMECVHALCSGHLTRAFAFVRPPGHHAEPDKAMGFCLFNNVALGAAFARTRHRLSRVAIVDIDLHHGNGTQACFYDDPGVLYISTHQYPFYPGTGSFVESGTGDGKGYSVNFPLPAGLGDRTIVPIYTQIVPSILEQYCPQLILVSAGFDAHFQDPLGELKLTPNGYADIASSLIRAAEQHCGGRICFVLEGGYSLDGLRDCTLAVLKEMELGGRVRDPDSDPVFQQISERAKSVFAPQWKW